MSKKKKRIFLTGASGKMGGAALKELLQPERQEQHEIVLLDLPTKRNIKRLKPYADTPGVEIVWGDLTRYEDVLKCVEGADVVLHAAALIPPAADHSPDLAWRVNVGSAQNIVRAIKAQPSPDAVKLVTVGTVAMTGDRLPPIHVGRTGDPIRPSIFDVYGCSKAAAERIVAESGLRHWVSLRQTFITTLDFGFDPIMFHQPLNTCLETCSERNAGLVLANAAEDDVPDAFWRRFYNIGGGPKSRTTFLQYMRRFLPLVGIKNMEDVFERGWFALRNFHCQWFEDAHILNGYLHHQAEGLDDWFRYVEDHASWAIKSGLKLVPACLMRRYVQHSMTQKCPDSTLYWLEHDRKLRLSAFYGSRGAFESIPDWGVAMPKDTSGLQYTRLEHGYDERKPSSQMNLDDMREAAAFRGGRCLSNEMKEGDLYTPLRWECAFGHAFDATPNLVLKGGHWCPECMPPGWNYDEQARRNPFLAQVWYPNHARDEHNVYPQTCMYDVQRARSGLAETPVERRPQIAQVLARKDAKAQRKPIRP